MSQLGRIVALVMITLMAWLIPAGVIGAVSASASEASALAPIDPPIRCC